MIGPVVDQSTVATSAMKNPRDDCDDVAACFLLYSKNDSHPLCAGDCHWVCPHGNSNNIPPAGTLVLTYRATKIVTLCAPTGIRIPVKP